MFFSFYFCEIHSCCLCDWKFNQVFVFYYYFLLNLSIKIFLVDEIELQRGLSSSFIDDGYLEIIGSKDDLLSQKKRWIRLDQVREIRFKFIEDSVEVVNMMIDGVLWKKTPLDGLVEIEISYNCQVNILVKQDYSARSIHDSSQPCGSETADDDNAEGRKKSGGASTSSFLIDDNELEEKSQGHKKIGAASSFKIFEEDDIN
ncbi:putative diacylglycerol kinase (ATP) [Rosa chinensis]|uniref:Putative diacylglycerol kinase (ATP) n=1 Tax=Rosa chinensis TaxID=74649 RepID=A0A2P6S0B6_ROSCH|nr:putative diacylglycerol kinase (ATP) [Rosa chinensis]